MLLPSSEPTNFMLQSISLALGEEILKDFSLKSWLFVEIANKPAFLALNVVYKDLSAIHLAGPPLQRLPFF
jgi:hypothetical protein